MVFANILHLPYIIFKLDSFDNEKKNTDEKLEYREIKWLVLGHTAHQ